MKTNVVPIFNSDLRDTHGNTLEVGQKILIASQHGKRGDVTYSEMLITGRTEKMIRAVKVSFDHDILQQLGDYARLYRDTPRQHGAILSPWNVYRLATIPVVPEKDIKQAMENPAPLVKTSLSSPLFTP